MSVYGECELESSVISPEIEAAYKICYELQEYGYLQTAVSRDKDKVVCRWKVSLDETRE